MPDRPLLQEPERVRDLPQAWRQQPSVVRVGDPLSKAVEALLAQPHGRAVYVVDADGKLVGVISFRSMLKVVTARYGSRSTSVFGLLARLRHAMAEHVEDLMREPHPVHPDTTLEDAFFTLDDSRENDLPIVDDDGKLVGELNAMQVMDVGLRVFRDGEAALAAARAKAKRDHG